MGEWEGPLNHLRVGPVGVRIRRRTLLSLFSLVCRLLWFFVATVSGLLGRTHYLVHALTDCCGRCACDFFEAHTLLASDALCKMNPLACQRCACLQKTRYRGPSAGETSPIERMEF